MMVDLEEKTKLVIDASKWHNSFVIEEMTTESIVGCSSLSLRHHPNKTNKQQTLP